MTKSPPSIPSCTIVIFGAAGDLTKRKLIPALGNLAKGHLLPENFAIVGVARASMNHEEFRQAMNSAMQELAPYLESEQRDWLCKRLYYLSGEFKQAETYDRLQRLLDQIDHTHHTQGNYLYYLATAPEFFCEIIWQLHSLGLVDETAGQWRRAIIEKPFGHDLISARVLNQTLSKALKEHQIYRIDHYLGKETVQNILVFRFGNGLFDPLWNHRYIDHVQITVAEQVGVENRGGYYDVTGALRDMVQNHLFQLLAMIAMEPPISFEADAVRDEKTKLLRSIRPLQPEQVLTDTVRGQYKAGTVQNKPLTAYQDDPKVASDSVTETFVALKLFIDNWRWTGVPFYLRTGKAMSDRVSEIVIQFKQVPQVFFRQTSMEQPTPNLIRLRIQPNEGIHVQFGAKVPGPVMKTSAVEMDFCYAKHFGTSPSTGYETLLYDCMIGDATLFQRADTVEISWDVITPVLDVWQSLPPRNFPNYTAGSWGPQESDALLQQDQRHWWEVGT